jgi:ribosomal protein L11 methyltransferase
MMLGRPGTLPALRPKELFVYECAGNHPPLGEPDDSSFLGIWPEHPFYYVFFEQEAGASFFGWLENQRGWMLRDRYHLPYGQWQQTSTETIRAGPFLIETGPEAAGAAEGSGGILIRLDPGVVFGSGLHGSTRGCLFAIAHLHERFVITEAVDMGTGTGILAISCGKLGATRVLAIDKNLLAIRTARKNVLLNGMEQRVRVIVADRLGAFKAAFGLLIMNLEWPVLKQLLAESEWQGFRWVILSGFLERQWDQLQGFLPPTFHLRHRVAVDGWLTVTISRGYPQ